MQARVGMGPVTPEASSTPGVRIEAPVASLDWSRPAERRKSIALLEACTAGSSHLLNQPVVLRGAVKHWPALKRWDLEALARDYPRERVRVRVAPSLDFYFTEPLLMPLFLRLFPLHKAPSVLVPGMPLSEAANRLLQRPGLAPLVYNDHEQYYLQTYLWPELMKDVDFRGQPFSAFSAQGNTGDQGLVVQQLPRLWLSPAGAVSPLHYDCSISFLVQVRGRKRMLFFRPRDLRRLYPYPAWHILRRRARVDPMAPNYKKYPRFRGVVATEAVLHPGDVIMFPAYWAHYTESLDRSTSLTVRFRPKVMAPLRTFSHALLVRSCILCVPPA